MNAQEKAKFVRNSILQLQKIEKQAVGEAKRTFRYLQRELKRDFETNINLIKPFLNQKLKPLFTKTLFVSYLLGQRRSIVCFEKNEGESLKLSIIDDMQKYLSNLYDTTSGNSIISINELQDLLETRSLRILNDVSDSIELQLRTKINDLIVKGYHIKEAVKELSTEFNNLGISETNDFQLETIFRTQTQMSYSSGNYQSIMNNEILREQTKYFEYSAVMDNRTTPLCEQLDGVRKSIDDPFWHKFTPPNHFNCRSVIIPTFDDNEKEVDAPKNLDEPDFNFNPGELF